jgi:hypothetical protein
MAVQKVVHEDKSPNKNKEMDYDVWIDINIKNICNKGRGRIEYINRENRHPNKYETQKIVDELSKLDLADANALTASLTKKGEEVCKAGGWIEYLKQQENQSSSLDNLETSITINNTIRDNSIPVTIPSKKKTIFGVGVWQIIIMIFFGILTLVAMFYIAYRQEVFE